MSDKPSSKGPFNFRAKPVETSKEADEELSKSKTDKDNASREFNPPDNEQRPARNKAPLGTVGNKGPVFTPFSPSRTTFIEFIPEGSDDKKPSVIDLSNDGTLIDGKLSGDYTYLVEPTYVNNECRISRLTLMKEGKPVAHFDGEWDENLDRENHQDAIGGLESEFGKPYSGKFKSFSDINSKLDKDDDLDI